MSFHVPERFRAPDKRGIPHSALDGNNGAFAIPAFVPGRPLWAIASDGGGWEHVSVSVDGRKTAIPNWEEMDYVCRIFWDSEDVVMQIHPARSQHVNLHPGCLHLWRPIHATIPLPDPRMVGGGTP